MRHENVIGRVTELIKVEMLKNKSLDGGKIDENMVEINECVCKNKSDHK